MLTVAIPKRNKLQNIIVLTPKDGITIKQNKIFDNTIPYFIRLSKGLFILQLSNSRVH